MLNAVNEDPDILACRLVANKITLVHRRLWPALAACAAAFDPACLARVVQAHSARGHHENIETPFPDWLPAGVMEEANGLDRDAALAALGSTFVTKPGSAIRAKNANLARCRAAACVKAAAPRTRCLHLYGPNT